MTTFQDFAEQTKLKEAGALALKRRVDAKQIFGKDREETLTAFRQNFDTNIAKINANALDQDQKYRAVMNAAVEALQAVDIYDTKHSSFGKVKKKIKRALKSLDNPQSQPESESQEKGNSANPTQTQSDKSVDALDILKEEFADDSKNTLKKGFIEVEMKTTDTTEKEQFKKLVRVSTMLNDFDHVSLAKVIVPPNIDLSLS